jgi:hypothetical protein
LVWPARAGRGINGLVGSAPDPIGIAHLMARCCDDPIKKIARDKETADAPPAAERPAR